MNKKRVALALAAALGVNTLVLSVGQVGGQVQIAHAQQSRLLTGSEDEKKLSGIKIKTLETTVETSSSNEVTLTFSGLTKDNVSNVAGTLSYEKFTERPSTDTNGDVLVVWDSSTGKAKVSGMDAPGIYSGDVTVTYKDGSTEVYNLTLRKTYEKDVLTATVDVGVGTIEVKNVKFGNNTVNIDSNNVLELYLSGSSEPMDVINTSDDSKFTVTGMEKGQVYDLVYRKDQVEQGRTQIILVEEDNITVRAYASNQSANFGSNFVSTVASDFGVSSVDLETFSYSNSNVSDVKSVFKLNDEVILDYEQSVSKNRADRIGGVNIEVSSNSTTSDSISVGIGGESVNFLYLSNAGVNGTNFLPSFWMKHGYEEKTQMAEQQAEETSTPKKSRLNGMYGKVNVTLDGETKTLLDASSKITSAEAKVEEVNGKKYAILNVSGVIGGSQGDNTQVDKVTFDYDTSGLSHGYNAVSVVFSAESTPFAGKTLSDWASEVRAKDGNNIEVKLPEEASTVSTSDEYITDHTTSSVKASLIVVKDSLDGVVVNSSFEKLSNSEGKLILSSGDALLQGSDENTLARKLSVLGSSGVSYIEKDSSGNLVFRVQFNGNVPSSIRWSLDKLGGTIEVNSIDSVNFDGQVVPSNANTDKLESYFEISAKFNSVVPSNAGTLRIDDNTSTQVTFDQLTNGKHIISAKVTSGSYQGTYSAGIWVNKQPFTIEAKDAKSASNTSATLTVDANFFSTDDISKVTGGVVQYSEKTVNGNTTTWSDWKDSSTIDKSEVKEDAITKTVTGLTGGKTYRFRVVYNYNDGSSSPVPVHSNVTGEVTLPTSSSNSTITGSGSSSTTTGTSTGSTTINVTTSNSTLSGTSASVTLPSGFTYDSSKTPVAVAFKYKGSDGKTVTETKEQYSNVSVRFNGNQVEVSGLVPGKTYDEITIDYTDSKGSTRSIVLRNVQTSTTVEVEKYLANVYTVVFNRPADEAGYHFHLGNLQNKKVSLKEFLLNMLTEKEFIERYKSTEEKIEALYNAIVGRSSDEAGKKFWVEEYKKVLAVYGSESTALKAIADRMVNENELKELADKMGVQW